MPKRGKKFLEAKKKVNLGTVNEFSGAVQMVLSSSFAKFDETVAYKLYINLYKDKDLEQSLDADYQISGYFKIIRNFYVLINLLNRKSLQW